MENITVRVSKAKRISPNTSPFSRMARVSPTNRG